jgi:organic radical activating enzyme
MQIIEVKQNWPKDTLRIDISLGNYCNYKCWYCYPGSNEGTYKFPDIDLVIKNLSHLLDYYLTHTDKTKFDFNLLGGEVTHWPKFIEFVSYFKKNYNCVITLTTNGSKPLNWWKQSAQYLDYVIISSHHQFADIDHIRQLADFLYTQKMIVVVTQLMDPTAWQTCLEAVEYFKGSQHKWPIQYAEVIDKRILYTQEQKNVIAKDRARGSNIFWFLKNNKSYQSKVRVVDSNFKIHKMSDNDILLKRLNIFKGWECNVGVDWLAVKMNGVISGICSNPLFDQQYNLYDTDFYEKFKPTIEPARCQRDACWCTFETNMTKKKVISTHAD